MAIDIRNSDRPRTYPRLQQCTRSGRIVLWALDGDHGLVLAGPEAGRIVDARDTDFANFEDVTGAVTLYNKD